MNRETTALNKVRRAHVFLLLLMLFPLESMAQEILPPVENVRVEDGAIVWEPPENILSIIGNRRLVYNIYRANPPYAIYVATVSDALFFRPSLTDDYLVVASDSGSRFSSIDEATVVRFTFDTVVKPGLTTLSSYEIRTNRCTDMAAGQSCSVRCGNNNHLGPTGGACRADGAVVLHQRARHDGYECITTADTAYVEADVFCHKQ